MGGFGLDQCDLGAGRSDANSLGHEKSGTISCFAPQSNKQKENPANKWTYYNKLHWKLATPGEPYGLLPLHRRSV